MNMNNKVSPDSIKGQSWRSFITSREKSQGQDMSPKMNASEMEKRQGLTRRRIHHIITFTIFPDGQETITSNYDRDFNSLNIQAIPIIILLDTHSNFSERTFMGKNNER
jgi:hypothetical protein